MLWVVRLKNYSAWLICGSPLCTNPAPLPWLPRAIQTGSQNWKMQRCCPGVVQDSASLRSSVATARAWALSIRILRTWGRLDWSNDFSMDSDCISFHKFDCEIQVCNSYAYHLSSGDKYMATIPPRCMSLQSSRDHHRSRLSTWAGWLVFFFVGRFWKGLNILMPSSSSIRASTNSLASSKELRRACPDGNSKPTEHLVNSPLSWLPRWFVEWEEKSTASPFLEDDLRNTKIWLYI